MNEYEGNWQTTYSGKKIHILHPAPEEIDIRDIAHGLSLTCRFGGQCSEFYSVAQHSIEVAHLVRPSLKLMALLHDAHEAYLCDVPRPVKHILPGYKEVADNLQRAIEGKYCFAEVVWANHRWVNHQKRVEEIKHADNKVLATEAKTMMANMDDWAELPKPQPYNIEPWSPRDAESSFMEWFHIYGGKE